MKNRRMKALAIATAIATGSVAAGASYANQSLEAVVAVSQAKVQQAQKSQVRINKLQDETDSLIAKYKQVSKTIEGLKVYNSQLEKQLESQKEIMLQLEDSVGQITVIQRQIQPLIIEMLDAIEQFIELDAPYRKDKRLERVADLRSILTDADVTIAEKFRQVLEIYSIESEYAKKIDTYPDTISVDGQDLSVDVLAIGRVALMYQTPDGSKTGAWDRQAKAWVELDSGYKNPVRNGIRMAQKKAQNDIMLLPIAAPEAAK